MVYVDNMGMKVGKMRLCNMAADTNDELLAMADKIGVQRRWIRHAGTSHERFNITMGAKAKAIGFGAKEISFNEMCDYMEKRITTT